MSIVKSALTALTLLTVTVPLAAVPAEAQRRDSDYDRDRGRDEYRNRDDRGRGDDRGRDYRWRGNDRNWDASRDYRQGNYRERRLGRNDQVFRGRDGRTYCRRNDGTTGLVIGGLGGGVLGNLIGGGTLGTLLGAGGGALLGREVDRGNVRCR